MKNIEELIRPDPLLATQGIWSGAEGRQRKRYIAIIPVSRYEDYRPGTLSFDCFRRRRQKVYSIVHVHANHPPEFK